MRILHVLGKLDIGGAENLIMNIFERLSQKDIVFDFVVHRESGAYIEKAKKMGSNIYYCPEYKVYNHFSYVKWWKSFFDEHPEYEIIHTHVSSTASIFLRIAKKKGLKTISHAHSTSNGKGIKALVKKVLQIGLVRYVDIALICSEQAGLWQFGNNYKNKCSVYELKNGVDVSRYYKDETQRALIKKELNLEDCFVVGNISRLVEAKNHKFLIESFYELVKLKPNAILLLVGEGPLKTELKTACKNYFIEDKVLFLGARQDIDYLLGAIDVFVFPSLWEGFGIAALEAQAAGVPTIISDGVPDMTCVTPLAMQLSLKNDAKMWAEKIYEAEYLEKKDYRGCISDEGFDIGASAKMLYNIYANAIGKRE